MDHARNHLVRHLRKADRHGRFRAFAALTEGNAPITIHSKVTIVDDRFLRIGSANLNNRSFGLDTECDLAVDVPNEQAQSQEAARAVRRVLVRILSEHLGASPERLAGILDSSGSLLAGVDVLNPAEGRRLAAFVSRLDAFDWLLGQTNLFDPVGADDNWRPWRRRSSIRRRLAISS